MTPAATLSDLLEELSRNGARLRLAAGGRLEVTAPRAGLSVALRDRIAANKPQLVAWLTAADDGARPEAGPVRITPDPGRRHDPFPLSDLQASFLIGSREGFELHVRPHQYMEIGFEHFDDARFGAAVNRALARQHGNIAVVRPDLRLEIVRDAGPVALRIEDVRGAPERAARDAALRTRAEMERAELPLDRWPWLDVRATLHGTDSAVVHLNSNNFFCDAAATGRLVSDILQCYEDPALRLEPPEVGYRDCVLALTAAEESEAGRRSRAYWYDRLADFPDAPAVPTVSGDAAAAGLGRRSHLSRHEIVLGAADWSAIRGRAAGQGLSATNTLLAVYAEVLSAWSGSRHFLINNMITHRVQLDPRAAAVLGNFASLYPLEVDWRAPGPFLARALRLQQRVLEDLRHLDWSGVKVLQELNRIRRTPGRAVCPFAVGSALFVGPADRPDYSVLETPQVLIDCEFWEQRDGSLWVVWDVVEELFPDGLVADMLGGFARALDRLAAGPEAWQAAALDLIAPDDLAERAAVNAAAAASMPEPAGLLHDALAERAGREPDRPAVRTADRVLGYGELYRRSLHLAALLRDRRVEPGALVAVVLPKGWRQAVAVYGILAAGCAYVPIDPAWPETRVAQLLESSEAVAAVTDAEHYAWLAAVTDLPVVDADNADGTAPGLAAAPGPRRAPTDPAYVIFTSGSTGEPKGAELDHRGPLTTIADVNRRFAIGPRDVLYGVSSLCFDLSVYDFFGSVHAGAELVLPPGGGTDPAAWAAAVAGHGVTVWNSVPAIMRLVAEAALAAGLSFPALRTVLLSGDWIPVDLPDQIRAVAPNARVISLGGATEASIWSIHHPIDRVDPAWVSIPYGRPLARQSWHVLDDSGRECPRWTPGHLYIGGSGVALGYLHDADKTAAAFVPHPLTGERLYRTGDLGRYLPGGDIEFLGRADDQVKIQGFRVEPGEVEHALLGHPGVRAAAVIARAAGGRAKQLAGFAAGHRGAPALEPDGLRAFLAARLPAHLVPTRIAVLDELPLTGNGKLDRRRLEALETPADRPAGTGARVEPDTPSERLLARIWREVLDCGPVGAHDDFFDLGGQSFAALRVSARIAAETGRHVPLGVLLERRTVAALGAWLDAADPDWSPLVRLGAEADAAPDAAPWFLIHPAGGGVLCYRELAAAAGTRSGALWALQAPGPAAGRPALDRMEDFVELYLSALAKARPHGPYRLAGWSSGAAIAFALAEELERRGESVERLVCVDAPAPGHAPTADERTWEQWFVEDVGEGVLDPAAAEAAYEVFRGILRACAGHRPGRIRARITLLRAGDGRVSEFAGHPAEHDPAWGWAALTEGAVTAQILPGTHYTLLTEPSVRRIAAALAG